MCGMFFTREYVINNISRTQRNTVSMKKIILLALFFMTVLTTPLHVFAEEKISVAVAANFISAFQDIAADFEERTGIKVEATFASTGSLYNQIKNGAPYDVFLSADLQRPDLLQKEGWTEGTIIYARGRVILWSANKDFCKAATWTDALKNDRIKKVAMANPLTAPYGASAKAALQKAGLWEGLQGKLVNAQDIAQSFQYASTEAVDMSFCALSATANAQGQRGCFYYIPEAADIVQAACVSKYARNKKCAELFLAYLICEHATKIKMKYGYR
ncbi:MAG: molybdate ABC transporter substrate-binding protein [Deltaproteobacteria bacterium]|nr:molybdate ABC transporter substrate-binding protein [Deltaproteobacteria bacterium]